MTYVPIIKTEEDHAQAQARLEELILADRAEDVAEMDALALLIEDYERKAHPIPTADPVEAILFRMEQMGMNQAELARVTHIRRSHLSEVLNKHRGLSISMMRALNTQLQIPLQVLFGRDEAEQSQSNEREVL